MRGSSDRSRTSHLSHDRYTGHSLRARFVTVAEAGASDREIARQTGHAPGSRALHRYIRHAAPDTENAAGRVI